MFFIVTKNGDCIICDPKGEYSQSLANILRKRI